MARRTFTNIVLALGLLCSIAAPTNVGAQQVTFALTPTQVNPVVGDTLKLNLTVQNFTNIVSMQYALEWDGALLSYVGIDSVNIPDLSGFGTNAVGNNTVLTSWAASGLAKSVPNGQRLYRLRLKVLAASSNYWVKFSTTNIDVIEIVQDPGQRTVTPSFVNVGTPPGVATLPVGAKITGGATLTNQKVCVPVTTSDFTNIVSAQWVNKWNPSVLRFDSISTLNSTLGLTMGNFSTLQASSGRVAFSWNASSGSVSVNNNDTLYKVCYTAVGANGTNSIVTFDSSEVYRRGNGVDARVSLNSVNGTVTVGTIPPPTTSNFTIAASNHNINSGDTVCVKLRVGAFTNIAVMQWSMHWDSTKMAFLGASSTAGLGIKPWLSPTDFGDFGYKTTGSLGFVWFDSNGTGVTLADSTILMEICFKYIGAANTSSTFRFDGIPVKVKITDGNFAVLPPTFRVGNVTVGTAAVPTSFTGVVKNVTCPSSSVGDGGITLTPSGGNGTYTYAWTGPSGFTASSKDLTARLGGKYYVTVTSNATTKVDSFTITEPTAFAISSQVTSVNCKGGATGAIVLTIAGGTAPYTYAWTGATTTPTAKDLTALTVGIYKLTLTDAKNCTTSRADTIKEPAAALTAVTVPTNSNCKNGNSGAIATTVSGGTAPYAYSWISTNGTIANTKDLTALAVGTYNLTVTDANSCKATRVETLTEPDSITIGSATLVGTRCSQLTGAITVRGIAGGTGAYSYAWTGPGTFTNSLKDLANIGAGQYTLTVKDSKNCASAATTYAVVDTAANITNSVPAVTNVTCFGGSNGAISLTATGASALTYGWTGPNGFTAATLSISNLKAGNYTLSISDAGCSKTIAASVNEPAAITSAKQSVNVKCKGDQSGSIALNATGGTAPLSISWTGPNGFTATGQSIGSLKVGTYVASILDANLCAGGESITITEPTDSLKITAAIKNAVCNGDLNGEIALTVTGGTPQYNYAWTGVGGFTSIQKDIVNRASGEYRVSVTDANGCRVERTLNIGQPGAIVVTAGTTDASGTPNGTISLTMAGGQAPFTFLWTGQGVAPTAQNQTGLCPGTYSVSVKDAGQCSVSKSITVGGSCSTPMRILGAPSISPAGCVGNNFGKIVINFEGGVAPFNVVWVQIIGNGGNNPDVFSEVVQARSSTLPNRPAGTYAVKITDAVGQTLATPPMVITGSATPMTITAGITDETCRGNDGAIVLSIRDGAAPYTVKWGDIVLNITERRNLAAGNYKATVTDNNNCLKPMDDILVKRTPCPLVITSSVVNPKCSGTTTGSITINISNGEPTYTVTSPTGQVINLPNATSRTNSYFIGNLGAGTYTVTIKDTINTPQTLSFTLVAPPQITVDRRVTGDQGSCNGSIILTVNGGVPPYRYQWNTGATSRDLFNLCCNDGKRYSVNVTDGNDCIVGTPNDTISCSIVVLSLDSSRVRDPLCKNDSTNSRIDVFVKGGVMPYVTEWRNSTGTVVATNTLILFNQPPGRYYLTVQDSRVPNPQRIVFGGELKIKSTLAILSPSTTDASDNDKADGTTTITINPGTGPYSIRWQDGSVSTTASTMATNSALKAGTGEVTVTDLLGCIAKLTVTIGSRACATIKKNTIFFTPKDTFNLRCLGYNDGGASIIAFRSDVVLPIRAFEWESSGETGQTAFKLAAGLNKIKITDANGKVCVSSFDMKAPPLLKDTVWVDDKARTLEAVPSGGVAPYTYLWVTTASETTRKITATKSGEYVVLVKDALGCDVTSKAKIIFDANCLDGAIILTPNDDGRNENFRFKSCGYKTVRLEVYNRWGQLVYSSNDYREQWYGNKEDGQFGDPLPEGVYMYILSATDASGKQQLGKGTVNIVRN